MQAQEERWAWEHLARIAGGQYGVVTSRQLSAHFHRRQAQRRLERGLLVRAAVGVWRLPSHPPSWEQQVMICVLAGGRRTVASHLSAGVIWELEGLAAGPVHVTLPRSRSDGWARRGPYGPFPLVVHHPTTEVKRIVRVKQFPVTTVARTLVDLAGLLNGRALASATDDALRRGLVSLAQLRAERTGRSLRGSSRLDRIIERRTESGVGESVWEDRIWAWIVGAGLPLPVRQFQVRLPTQVARIDLAYPSFKIAIEFDGFAWHGTRERFDRDRVRLSQLALAGWTVLTVTSNQSQRFVVDMVRQALVAGGWRPDAESTS